MWSEDVVGLKMAKDHLREITFHAVPWVNSPELQGRTFKEVGMASVKVRAWCLKGSEERALSEGDIGRGIVVREVSRGQIM